VRRRPVLPGSHATCVDVLMCYALGGSSSRGASGDRVNRGGVYAPAPCFRRRSPVGRRCPSRRQKPATAQEPAVALLDQVPRGAGHSRGGRPAAVSAPASLVLGPHNRLRVTGARHAYCADGRANAADPAAPARPTGLWA
jgi:hypothetical protein